MDVASTTEPKSDQQNFDDYIGGPKTVTVEDVKQGNAEQPVELHLVEFPGRPYKPAKSMRRVLVKAWGAKSEAYKGRRITLYGDPTVRFGGKEVGGIRISHLSAISEPLSVALTITRGKREPFVVQPLPDVSGRDWAAELELAGDDVDAVSVLGQAAREAGAAPRSLAAIRSKYRALTKPADVEAESADEPEPEVEQ